MLAATIQSISRRLSLGAPLSLSRVSSTIRVFSSSGGWGGGGGADDSWGTTGDGGDGGKDKDKGKDAASPLDWGEDSSWSTGLTKDHFDGDAVGRRVDAGSDPSPAAAMDELEDMERALEKDNRRDRAFVDGWGQRMTETYQLLKQVWEPGARGSYLKDSEKAEMYRLHKENPEEYTVERLAKDYRIMRQRVHAILWLKEMEEEEEEKKKRGPLDDSVEILLDNFPEFFNSHDRVLRFPTNQTSRSCQRAGTAPREILMRFCMKSQ